MKIPEIVLASGSPRRHEILRAAGLGHRVLTAAADERAVEFHEGEPERYACETAKVKSDAVWERYSEECVGKIVLSADTVVYAPWRDEALGKPKDEGDARRMLTELSGRTHRVVTGVTLRYGGESAAFAESTDVTFRALAKEEIEEYCRTPEPYDKAGGYGIQGRAGVFVRCIRGDYYNVVGLPVCRVYEEILRLLPGIL